MTNNDESDKKIDILIVHAVQTNERLTQMGEKLDVYNDELKDHTRRSLASENRQEIVENRLEFIEDEIKPMLEHFNGLKWAIGSLSTVAIFLEIVRFFKN